MKSSTEFVSHQKLGSLLLFSSLSIPMNIYMKNSIIRLNDSRNLIFFKIPTIFYKIYFTFIILRLFIHELFLLSISKIQNYEKWHNTYVWGLYWRSEEWNAGESPMAEERGRDGEQLRAMVAVLCELAPITSMLQPSLPILVKYNKTC